jgi:hypothetical protein
MHSKEPQAVPAGVVENLVAGADAQGNVRFDFRLREGDAVKVTAGPFADFVSRLERLDDHGRVRVLLLRYSVEELALRCRKSCLRRRKTSPETYASGGGLDALLLR